jgi:hypothetical protein
MPAEEHVTFKRPSEPDIKIWRYMSLTKFLWMLQHNSLYFSRSDLMGDPFEGHYSLPTAQSEDEFVKLQLHGLKTSELDKDRQRKSFRSILSGARLIKPSLFVNCWHMNEYESLAMWKLYAAHHDSICIQSRASTLISGLPNDVFVGMVKYIDYNKEFIDWGNALEYIVHKRVSFAHERELRAVIWKVADRGNYQTVGDKGLIVPIDIKSLIETVFVSPESDPVLVDVLEGLRADHGFPAQIVKSDVNAGPHY